MITPQALRTMPQAASLGPQHRSDAMKKGVGDCLAAGRAGRWREEGPVEPGESEQELGARAAEDGQPGAPPRGRGLRPQLSRRGGRREEMAGASGPSRISGGGRGCVRSKRPLRNSLGLT